MDHLRQIIEALVDQLHDHSSKILTALFLMALGWFFGRRRARHAWQKREFFDRLNVSLNLIDQGTLKIRTFSEKRCEEVFLNQAAADKAMEYARKTTPTDPLLPIPQDDYWHFLNPVLNELSEQFADGALRMGLGQPVQPARFLVCLTCEAVGQLRMRKIRAMVIRKDTLLALPEKIAVESSHHETRWQTLQFMAREYASRPWRFIEVELCV